MYTNRTSGPQYAAVSGVGRVDRRLDTNLVDNLGNRHPYVTDSFGGSRSNWPLRSAGKLDRLCEDEVGRVLCESGHEPGCQGRGVVPLPPASSATPGLRYGHRLFAIELKNVEVVGDEVKVNLK